MRWPLTRKALWATIIATLMSSALSCWLDYQLPKSEWQCTAFHRESPEPDQHDLCDQYSRIKGIAKMNLLKRIWNSLPFDMTDAVIDDQRVAQAAEPNQQNLKLKWPDTTPIDKTDPYWEFNNNTNINGIPYHKEEVAPGKWQWVVNQKILAMQRESDSRRRKLAMDLQTRVLNEEEMREVKRQGIYLFVENMVGYRESDKQKEFNEAICQQYRLRAIAKSSSPVVRNSAKQEK